MGTRKHDQTKRRIRTIIKVFLLCNKGEKYSSKELCDFINGNRLGLHGHDVNPKEVTHYIRTDWHRKDTILHDVLGEKQADNRYLFWLPDDDEGCVVL